MDAPARTPRSLLAFAASTVAIAIAYASAFLPGGAPAWAPWLLGIGAAGSMTSVMVLGASRPGRSLGALRWAFGAVFLLMAGGIALALALPPETAATPLVLGVPRRAAILLFGIGVVPLLFLPVAYGLTFDRVTLSEADLETLRARAAALREDTAR